MAQVPVSEPDIQRILSTIKQVESGGNYGIKAQGSSASGAYQFIDKTWQDSTKKYGIGTEYKSAKDAPPEIQDAVAQRAVRDILGQVGGDVSKVPLVWYTGNPQGRMTEEQIKANQGQTADQYQKKWLATFGRGVTTKVATAPAAQPSTATRGPRTTAQVGGGMTLASLPENYRIALATSYLGETEDPEEAVAEKALRLVEESQQGGGAAKTQKLLAQAVPNETVNPFKFLEREPEPQRRRPVPRMPRMMAAGGPVGEMAGTQAMEVDGFSNGGAAELTDEEKQKAFEEHQARTMAQARYFMGPMVASAVKKPGGYEARIAAPIRGVEPYVDVNPMSGRVQPTEYGVQYGQMGPQGGHQLRYAQPIAPSGMKVPPQITGQYRRQLDRDSEIQASGFYAPIPNMRDAYGANVRYVRRFEDGGIANANPADIAEQMTVGTLPEDQKPAGQVFRGIGRDIVRGAQYLPYDLLGAPVDIATMAMRPFGYNVEKPVGGSEYLIEKAAQAGIADRPTGSLAETASRIGMGFVNPAAGARQIGRGIEAIESAVKAPIDRAKIRAAASRAPEDVAYDPLRERLESQGILSLATRPKGSAIDPKEDLKLLQTALQDKGREDIAGLVEKSFIPKLKNYLNRQFGTVDDPLYEATVSGKFLPQAFYRPNSLFRFEEQQVADVTGVKLKNGSLTMEHMNKLQELAKENNPKAIQLLGRGYDISGATRARYIPSGDPKDNPTYTKIYAELEKQAGDRPMTKGVLTPDPVDPQFLENISPNLAEELARRKPVYEMVGSRAFGGITDYDDVVDYMATNDPKKWAKMSVPELVLASNQDISKEVNPAKIAKYAYKGKELVPFQKLLGTETYLPLENSPALGKGAEWREIKTKEALLTEGGRSMLDHCLKSNTLYCNMLEKGEAKYFSLRDADGHPHATILVKRDGDKGPYNVITQIKGFQNSNTLPLYGEEVSNFLDHYQKTLGTKLKFSENPEYVPSKYGPKNFGIADPERNNGGDDWDAVRNVYAKGGMVDKPLYDRAA